MRKTVHFSVSDMGEPLILTCLINANIRNEKTMIQQLMCVLTKLPIFQLLTILDYSNLYKMALIPK